MENESIYEKSINAFQYLKSIIGVTKMDACVFAGSGLFDMFGNIQILKEISYEEVPFFNKTTVIGHRSFVNYCKIEEKDVLLFSGRSHYYEGQDRQMTHMVLPIYVAKHFNAQYIFLTNAVGAINKELEIGDVVFVHDHINLVALAGNGCLVGPNDDRLGTRFPSSVNLYDRKLIEDTMEKPEYHEILSSIKRVILFTLSGPCYETPAEIRFLRTIGADIVGMSTAHEASIACYAGLKVIAISTITNKSIDDLNPSLNIKVTHEEVIRNSKKASHKTGLIISSLLKNM